MCFDLITEGGKKHTHAHACTHTDQGKKEREGCVLNIKRTTWRRNMCTHSSAAKNIFCRDAGISGGVQLFLQVFNSSRLETSIRSCRERWKRYRIRVRDTSAHHNQASLHPQLLMSSHGISSTASLSGPVPSSLPIRNVFM